MGALSDISKISQIEKLLENGAHCSTESKKGKPAISSTAEWHVSRKKILNNYLSLHSSGLIDLTSNCRPLSIGWPKCEYKSSSKRTLSLKASENVLFSVEHTQLTSTILDAATGGKNATNRRSLNNRFILHFLFAFKPHVNFINYFRSVAFNPSLRDFKVSIASAKQLIYYPTWISRL